ncbi:MFS transporter [Siccirubricoccus phaeus]|uniref:MFS transporter n=1 Tax=Siccirubricoccus phaeus TaxID=2595053 RepID=UPI0011F0C78B|nr:MFS transporter [Siccirubricoccus phaeus]
MTPQSRAALLLGTAQTLAWATSYYLPAVVAPAVVQDLQAEPALVYGAFSAALLLAGLAAPRVGRAIEGRGGRPVLMLSSLVIALGLALLGLLPGLWGWVTGWLVLGLGMSAGLYEAAFATLGVLFGRGARRPITVVTLFAGFASTIGWPLSTALLPLLGWRGTCLAYAVANLLIALPLYALLPRAATPAEAAGGPQAAEPPPPPLAWVRRSVLLLAMFFTLRSVISGALSVHLLSLLGGLGLSLGAAVAAAALQGPSQVGGRLLEFTAGRGAHPLVVARLGGVLLPLGALLLVLAGPLMAVPFVMLYGASNGILTISRGAVPLALFGPRGYPVLMGKLALPILVSQALAPTLAAPVVANWPAAHFLGAAGVLALVALGCLLAIRPIPAPEAVPARR